MLSEAFMENYRERLEWSDIFIYLTVEMKSQLATPVYINYKVPKTINLKCTEKKITLYQVNYVIHHIIDRI